MRILNAVVLGVLAIALSGGHIRAADSDPEEQSFELRLKWLGTLSPRTPLWPTDRAECQALQKAWTEYDNVKTQVHNECLAEPRAAHSSGSPAGDSVNGCIYAACQPYHGPSGGAEDISDCFAAVSKVEERNRKEALTKQREEQERKLKQQRTNADSDSPPTPARPKEDATRSSSVKTPKRSEPSNSADSWAVHQQKLAEDDRKWRQEQAERQAKADSRAIEFAKTASKDERAALNTRTAEREAESERVEAQLAAAGGRLLTETQSILERANNAVARLGDAFSSPLATQIDPVTTGSAGVSSASDFDFSTLNSRSSPAGVNTGILDTIGAVAQVRAPFSSIPFSFVTWIGGENLRTLDQLSRVISNFDTATAANVERVWQTYHQRVWAPEQWLAKLAVETSLGVAQHYAVEPLTNAATEAMMTPVRGMVAPARAQPIVFKPADEPGWWTGGAIQKVGPDLERDVNGIPLLRKSNGEIYGFDRTTRQVAYSRLELEQLVASGDYAVFRTKTTGWQWTNNHVMFLPAGPLGPGGRYLEPKLRPSESAVFVPSGPAAMSHQDQLLESYVFSPVETGIAEALGYLAEKAMESQFDSGYGALAHWLRSVSDSRKKAVSRRQ